MSGLLDFLQSASNSAAGTVSGPIDLLSMVLRKAGVPVPQNALGSSEWMKQKGLMADVPQSAASLAGETFGLLSPVVAAAKAPQIAGGLLKMGENAAAPRTLNPQTGAIDANALRDMFPDVDFSLSQSGDKAVLSRVVVPKSARNQGRGSEFMAALVRAADDDSARLGLSPSSDFGGSKGRLEEFYRRFGFVPNKGRNKDFEFMESMVRAPKP